VLRHGSTQGRVGAPPTQSLTVSVAPRLGLISRIVIVPCPGPDDTGVGSDGCDVAGGAEGAVGALLLLHPALTTARTAATGKDKRCIWLSFSSQFGSELEGKPHVIAVRQDKEVIHVWLDLREDTSIGNRTSAAPTVRCPGKRAFGPVRIYVGYIFLTNFLSFVERSVFSFVPAAASDLGARMNCGGKRYSMIDFLSNAVPFN
jgi:hypothetical protein